ncbi:TIGR00268 family protein [Vibrio inusitatus NBRC 102082]|uniref:TIGR00268 family protein n=1 Tax=Vibrio inusitatus NBRC 102082 TaxID=1219070 RepID=A0A4Y3HXW3_9VIBR|nr:ATP-dependent sacrificial sulfur transferase LarE [Vibrio inusitatus]GEA51875.1 TIGR00268 family protein [Vibrio inusitatus NBRC 102082]
MNTLNHKLTSLEQTLNALGKITVAVSGGVDSMTLAFVAHRVLGDNAKMVHSISPAVPPKDTQRIRDFAAKYQWNITFVSSGEIDTPSYQNNPVNRCYYCKTCLYSTLKALSFGQVVSGTNLDDLDDYRPGLIAAKEHRIVHPFVEANIDKQEIRQLALQLGLPTLSSLPASPCLASRIETGIHIDSNNLGLVDAVEQHLRSRIDSTTLRCRVKKQQIGIEVDSQTFENLTQQDIDDLKSDIAQITNNFRSDVPIQFMPYQRGSAFVGDKQCQASL